MIRIRQQAEGFSLSFKDRQLFSHSRGNPALSVGRGQGRYSSVRGHFRVADEVRERIRCRDFRVLEESAGRAVVAFADLARLEFTEEQGRLVCRIAGLDPVFNRLWLELHAEADEAIYGCGEQYSRLNLRGCRLPIWSQEQGVGRGLDPITLVAQMSSGSGGHWYSSYFPMALFLSSRNWYCYCDTPGYSEFDFRDRRRHRLAFWQIPGKLVFDVGESAPALVGALSGFMGRQPPLPGWTQKGMWLGVQGGPEVIRAKLERALQAGVNVTALWVQDWVGRRLTSFGSQLMWNWRYDAERYPGLPELIEELHGRGIRFLGYINPFLAVERELYREASARGYCVRNQAGGDLMVTITDFPAAMIDLTNPAAREWIKGIIRENMLGIGLDGWMADYGEYLPPGAVLHSGESWERVHNSYPVLWAQANREAVAEAGREGDVVFFMRAGYHGSTRLSPAFWAGDQLVSWSINDGLATVIPAGISLGLQGGAHFHSDLGGFTTVAWVRRSKELFLRWAELAAFTPQMRSHEGNRPQRNWQFDSDRETLEFLARMTRVFDGLEAYRRQALQEYQANGLAPIRHPYLHYESDPRLHKLKYQYLLGRDLLVAPVISPRRRYRYVYLPEDRWTHLWSGKPCKPGWQRVAAPLGAPPVFFREGSPFEGDFAALRRL
ncbi:MAG: alpha-glucosidase [Spirochaetales bacterium]|nr:alpha-glucosidase [Spirochaetales bacterium]